MKDFIKNNLMLPGKDIHTPGNIFNSNRLKLKWFVSNNFEPEYNKLRSLFPDNEVSFGCGLVCVLKDIIHPNICSECGKNTHFCNNKRRYQQFCSNKCYVKNEDAKKYRVSRIDSSLERKEQRITKIRETHLNKTKEEVALSVSKNKQTKLIRYGDSNYNNTLKRCAKRQESFKKIITAENYERLTDAAYLENEYSKGKSAQMIANSLGVGATIIIRKLHEYGVDVRSDIQRSSGEIEVCEFLDTLNVSYNISNKTIISPLELDIYIPGYNLAIEYDGLYWHSEKNGKNKEYHLRKTEMCEKAGIQLLHIFDNEWVDVTKREIWKSIIKYKLGLSTRIHARECDIQLNIDNNKVKQFLIDNHIQGFASSSNNFGLYYKNELVSVMTVSKSRYSNKAKYELVRFCNKTNCYVVGGFSKLLKKYKDTISEALISYANRRWSMGNVYNNSGFMLDGITPPNYFYTKDYKSIYSRQKFQKHKLNLLLPQFDNSKTEWENMAMNRYDRIWDCGNLTYLHVL